MEEEIELRSPSPLATRVARFVPLYQAALAGDWEAAKKFLDSHKNWVSERITNAGETALHIAAGARHTKFVVELLKLMDPIDIALKNKNNNTALCFAAASGITEIARAMVERNKHLPMIRGSEGVRPVCMAALLGNRDMAWYLYSVTNYEDLTEDDLVSLLIASISTNLYDLALFLLQKRPTLAIERDGNQETALHVLARMPSAFKSGCHFNIWQRCIYSCIRVELPISPYEAKGDDETHMISEVIHRLNGLVWNTLKLLVPGIKFIYDKKVMHIQALEVVKCLWKQILLLDDLQIAALLRGTSRPLFVATELGIIEFVTVLIRSYPDLFWKVNQDNQSIFHTAVTYRQESIFNHIYDIGGLKDLIASYRDGNNNNMLHLAAKLAPTYRLSTISGAALQMQREYQWFKEVENIVQPMYTEMKDSEGRTPRMLFTEEHASLVREGEKWMKDTATSCMVVSTLIATVMFAAAFTVPGGNNGDSGKPIFLQKRSFMVFAISDALALFSSATSILMFLSILTSCYAEEDFLRSLPRKLVLGLATLFISIATMMTAFSATLFIVLADRLAWVALPIAIFACVPVTLYALLQFPLFANIIQCTYGSSMFHRPRKHMLY